MASTVEIAQRIQTLQNRIAGIQSAIAVALGQPATVSIAGSISYTHHSLELLQRMEAAAIRELAALQTGNVVTRTLPRYTKLSGTTTGLPM